MKSHSQHLLDRAILAMAGAIELYNKPGFPYRNESFAVLAINAWELLLKSKWLDLHNHRKQSLYVYENVPTANQKRSKKRRIKRTRSNSPFTHSLGHLAQQLANRKILHPSALKNLDTMLEFRDCATHFYNDDLLFNRHLYEIGAACVKNFARAVRDWFKRDVLEFNNHLMPLTFMALPSSVKGAILNAEQTAFVAFLSDIATSGPGADAGADAGSDYSVSVSVELKFIKSQISDAVPVQITSDPTAVPIRLTDENIRKQYPWSYKRLTDECRKRYANFKVNKEYHVIRKGLEGDDRYCHTRFLDQGNARSPKMVVFSPQILSEFDKHY